MQRREFHKGAVTTAVLSLFGLASCGGGGGGGSVAGAAPGSGPEASGPVPASGPATAPAPGVASAPAPAVRLAAMGTNLSGMEWANGIRVSANTAPNLHFTVPRAADVAWLAANGFGRNRLPIQWELLQPMLADTPANAQAQSLIGQPGALHEGYAGYIQGVLDAHAAAGARCIIDLHNYCRYRDFRWQPDGSVIGLTRPADPVLQAYTTDASQVWQRIFATAPGASMHPPAFADFWARVATRWKDHPGFGGYGLMNEPHDMPRPGQTVESTSGGEDLNIWPVFARAAIAAIRAIDAVAPIYLSGNAWGGAMNIGPQFNPAWPLAGTNLIYEVHSYLDAFNNGAGFDWDIEVAKNYTAGFGVGPMTLNTGVDRMRISTEWARAHGTKVALTETGMPIDDPRWHEAFRRLVEHSWQNGCEIHTWMGGSHWAARNHAINHVPGWHQNRTLEPLVAGPLKAVAGIDLATLFDDGPGAPSGGAAVTITVYARGNLVQPVTLSVSSSNGGSLSKSTLVIPAGANGQDSYTFTPAANSVATLSYTSTDPGRQVPPPRKVYALADPVAYAATSLADAALAILARYSASKWDLADGYTDFLLGRPAGEGDRVRAVADSGFGSSAGNAMEMLNWMNQDGPGMGPMVPPVMRTAGGRKHADLAAEGSVGLWCKKVVPGPTHPKPHNQVPYGVGDPHFAIAVVSVPGATSGVVFQAAAEQGWHTELAVSNGQPQARWVDGNGQAVVLASGAALAPNVPAVLTLTAAPGAQRMRVNSAVVGSAAATFAPSPFGQMLIGWGDPHRGAAAAFRGSVYAVITGRGNPTAAELAVLERYLGSAAGV